MSQRIEYYRIRDFSQKFNATIEYLRQHFLSLFILILVVTVPFTVVGGFIQYYFFAELQGMTFGANDPFEIFNLIGEAVPVFLLSMTLSLVLNSALFGSIFTYMRMTENNEQEVRPLEVIEKLVPKLAGIVVISVATSIISVMGMFFFLIPGIYLAVVFSLTAPVYVFEDISIGEAISKPFTLIRGKWWSTFGLLVVTIMLVSILTFAIALPIGIVIGVNEVFGSEDLLSDQSAQFWQVVSSSVINSLSYVLFTLPSIALAFQYFNLTERTEGRGLKSEIEGFENIK
ncbi:MAG: hypothetical protein R8G66_14240 [Cytophagales bacterium]|nr:hypothetical protein [Cytophagales bacterium]